MSQSFDKGLDKNLEHAVLQLEHGGCVAMPTETVYGLAARIDRPKGIESIFKLKQRPSFDPLIVHICDITEVPKVASQWPPIAQELADKFWPGPLTIVVPKRRDINSMITSGLETVGLRMPQHPLALELLRKSGPLAAPSANLFGRTSPTTIEHVRDEFSEAVADGRIVLLDGGPCQVGVESTVVQVESTGARLLRPGGIAREEIELCLKTSLLAPTEQTKQASPGHLLHHYQPKKPLIVAWDLSPEKAIELLGLRFRSLFGSLFERLTAEQITDVRLPAEAALAARLLYARLREADQKTGDVLIVFRDSMHSTGLWEAIDDRLKRAASANLK